MKVRIKRVDKSLPLPEYYTKGAVAFDLYSRIDMQIPPQAIGRIPTNLIVEIPEEYMLLIKDRSSTAQKKGLLTTPGFIDQDFHGPEDEILLQVFNFTSQLVKIIRGERLGQAAFVKIAKAEWQEAESELNNQSRGGFGSTG